MDVLPIGFTDDERPWVAHAVDSQVASLDIDAEMYAPSLAVAGRGRDHFVVAPRLGPVSGLAERYAAITDRSVIHGDPASIESQLPGSAPRSVTWFCPLDEVDLAESLRSLRATFGHRYAVPPRLGILTAEDLTRLTWMVAKQLLPPRGQDDGATTVLRNIESNLLPLPSATFLEADRSPAEALALLEEASGTLIIIGHSRPHCGRLVFQGRELGVCGLRSGGADGCCVDGVICHFGGEPRFVAQRARARRIYYDGCSTAKVGGRRVGLFGLPREAMLSHAVLRSAAREYIGKVHAGSFGPADLYWLLGLSALGYTPAECVEMMDGARSCAGREAIGSGAYFGDPTNAPWPTCDASIGNVSGSGGVLRLRWPMSEGVLVARLPGRSWAELMERDLLDIHTEHPSKPLVTLLRDPWSDASIVLAIPRARGEATGALDVELRTLETAVSRDVGRDLADAVENIGWLATLPSFREALAGAARQLEDELVEIRRTVAEREDRALLLDLVGFVQRCGSDAAHRFDGQLMDNALQRSRTRWELLEEYEGRSHPEHLVRPSRCGNCGASTLVAERSDYARTRFKRLVSTCPSCGIVADLPVWPLEISLDAASLRWVDRTLLSIRRLRSRACASWSTQSRVEGIL